MLERIISMLILHTLIDFFLRPKNSKIDFRQHFKEMSIIFGVETLHEKR